MSSYIFDDNRRVLLTPESSEHISRRRLFQILGALGLSSAVWSADGPSGETTGLVPAGYRPGRIDNEYSLFLSGEQAALKAPPTITSVTTDSVTAHLPGQSRLLR